MSNPEPQSRGDSKSRRDFIRKLAYTTPVLLTLPATPALAQVGSGGGPACVPSVFNNFCVQPPTDQYGCRIGSEFPTFGPNGEFLGCSS